MDLAHEKGASTWLISLPLGEFGFSLHKGAFRDALALCYGWLPSNTPTYCECGASFSVEHALSCLKGGFPSFLQHLRDAGLRLKPFKCSFFQQEVKYLGHVISRTGISTDPDRVLGWLPPKSKREVQRFLGFASYYRRFVKDFAHIAQPLHRLTQNTASFAWTSACQDAFPELCRRLCSAPVLAYPNFSRQFILDTDASDVGIGAVLSQLDDEGREWVVAYGSRTLSKAERRYCVTLTELLAVVVFTQQYRPYLAGPAHGPWLSDLAQELQRARGTAGTLAGETAGA